MDQSNVLVDAAGQARIADFYLATITTDMNSEPGPSSLRNNVSQWTAPEVSSRGKHSKESDIFSLAMVMTEVGHRWHIV